MIVIYSFVMIVNSSSNNIYRFLNILPAKALIEIGDLSLTQKCNHITQGSFASEQAQLVRDSLGSEFKQLVCRSHTLNLNITATSSRTWMN